MIEDSKENLSKTKFMLFWIIANAIGLGAGWLSGEILGFHVAKFAGWRAGQVTAIIIFEGLLWLIRWAVFVHFPAFNTVRPLEIVVWISTEWIGWIIGEAPVHPDSLMQFTTGPMWAAICGISPWILLGSIKRFKPGKKIWQIEAFLRTLIAFIGSVVLTTLCLITCLELSEAVTQLSNIVVGIIIAGTVTGALLGAITGIVFIKISSQRRPFIQNPPNIHAL
jgi:hypothetical protein